MTSVTPIQQPCLEDLKNALQVAEFGSFGHYGATTQSYRDIARLIRHAIEGLSEPNLAAVQAAEILVREYHGSLDDQRNARDVAAGILHSQLTGIVPKTWERE